MDAFALLLIVALLAWRGRAAEKGASEVDVEDDSDPQCDNPQARSVSLL